MKYPTYLIHYGIPGQKWGVRRYQNTDGTYTDLKAGFKDVGYTRMSDGRVMKRYLYK